MQQIKEYVDKLLGYEVPATKGLYVVATPIGNAEDISIRALRTLHNVDFIIGEEERQVRRLMKIYGIDKPFELLNEHNEKEQTPIIFEKLQMEGLSAGLVSDAGTPVFADPGQMLVNKCLENNIEVHPVPGACSMMAALMAAGVSIHSFSYIGFLPANREQRLEKLRSLRNFSQVQIFLDTPYRLKNLLHDFVVIYGDFREAILAYKLTQPEEKIFYGTFQEIQKQTANLDKGEFVLIVKRPERKPRENSYEPSFFKRKSKEQAENKKKSWQSKK